MNKKKIFVMQIEMMVNKKKIFDEQEKIFVTMIVTMQGERRDDLLPLLCPPHTVTFSNHHHSFLPEYQIFLLQQLNHGSGAETTPCSMYFLPSPVTPSTKLLPSMRLVVVKLSLAF